MRRVRNASAALLLGLLCAVLVACGSDDRSGLIPSEQAGAMNDDLAAVRAAVDDRDCTAATDAVRRARSTLSGLDGDVDAKLASNLRTGLDRLAAAARTECEEPPAETTPVETTPTTTTPTTTTTTIPTTTTTVPPTPTATTPPATTPTPTQTTPPPDPGGVAPEDPAPADPDVTGGTGGTP